MKTLIVGYGSIGRLHARLLRPLSDTLGIVTAQEASEYPLYRSLEEALRDMQPDYVVISTVTARHAENLAQLKSFGFKGKVLVEKPVFNHADENAAPYPFSVFVGYQLRFHKVIGELKEILDRRKVVSATAYTGQHLSQWRPGRDPKETYSAHSAQGGGVMRDLSHELDLAQFLFGPISQWEGKAERMSNVTVDSEDSASFDLVCKACPQVHVALSYLDEAPRREWVIETNKGAVTADLIRRSLTVDGHTRVIPSDNHEAYLAMHQAVLGHGNNACTLEDGLQVVKVIDSITIGPALAKII